MLKFTKKPLVAMASRPRAAAAGPMIVEKPRYAQNRPATAKTPQMIRMPPSPSMPTIRMMPFITSGRGG